MTTSSPNTTTTLPTTTFTNSNYKKFLVVSDVHNHLADLESLLEFNLKNHYTACGILEEGFHIIFLGDLIHKGPGEDCAKVVSLVQNLVDKGHATCIRGNHDFTPRKGKYGNPEHEGDLSDEQAEWLKSRPLFVRYDGWLFMHGGMTGSCQDTIQKLIDEGQLPEKGDWTAEMVNSAESSLSSKYRKKLQNCMYTRYVRGEKRQLVSWGNESPEDPYWAADYDGRYGFVLFGHNPWLDVAYFPCALGIDLGAGSLPEDLDTPKHGLGYGLRARRMCAVKLDRGVVSRVSAFCIDTELGLMGMPQFSDGVGLPRDWAIDNFKLLQDKPFEVTELYQDYQEALEDCDPDWSLENRTELALNGVVLNSRYGFGLSLPECEPGIQGVLRYLVDMSSLNIEHAAGSDESPTARLKHSLIESSLDSIIIGLEYGLDKECEEVINTKWMPLVSIIKGSDGYGQDFRDLIASDYNVMVDTGITFQPLLGFYEELMSF